MPPVLSSSDEVQCLEAVQVLHCGMSREATERAERRSKKYMPKNLDNAGLYINVRNNLIFEGTPSHFPPPYDQGTSPPEQVSQMVQPAAVPVFLEVGNGGLKLAFIQGARKC